MFLRGLLVLLIFPVGDESVPLVQTNDSDLVEFYDCFEHQGLAYCRRPSIPIRLERDKQSWKCRHTARQHSFLSLKQKNISIYTLLHQWNSDLDKIEEYSYYQNQWNSSTNKNANQQYICECKNPQLFGKYCEYFLFNGQTIEKSLSKQYEFISEDESWNLQMHGDIICYETLICQSGLLCLDWREICDGVHQCAEGFDEENCDKLELNECEIDEYRCLNGMCIPNEYFLDGDYDCLDLSDEKESLDDYKCSSQFVNTQCDDRICQRDQWSCGDGQCIVDRFDFHGQCRTARDQFHLCEFNRDRSQWTLPNGKCHVFENSKVDWTLLKSSNECVHFVKCALAFADRLTDMSKYCQAKLYEICRLSSIKYPRDTIITPYMTFHFNLSRQWINQTPDWIEINGTIQQYISSFSDLLKLKQTKNVSEICSNIEQYRFRCSKDQPTCLPASALADDVNHCQNHYDERLKGIGRKLSTLNCNSKSKVDCQYLREYIRSSWIDYENNQSSIEIQSQRILFRDYCNTFWDWGSKADEDIRLCQKSWQCPIDQWQCRTGQCIEFNWILDGEWDCADGSDEETIFASENKFQIRNFQLINQSILINKFQELYKIQSFSTICNLSYEYPCLRVNISNPTNVTWNRPCIHINQLGDDQIDCLGGIDERNTLKHCHQSGMLGNNFKCSSIDNHCQPYPRFCREQCSNKRIYCFDETSADKFLCFNGQSIQMKQQCDEQIDCSYGEDEYMCVRQNKHRELYRSRKEDHMKYIVKSLELPRFPSNRQARNRSHQIIRSSKSKIVSPKMYFCNRGFVVQFYNKSLVCFCPPQYYGDRCQYHSDRLSVLLHVNFSQSIYIHNTTLTANLQFLVLFLYENEILMKNNFYIRIIEQLSNPQKYLLHFLYSRSLKRNFTHHAYSIRIEAYYSDLHIAPQLVAVWLFKIDFNFLPNYRLSKILYLSTSSSNENPCQSSPCHIHQTCHPILNKKSQYICLCRENYSGPNCSSFDRMCSANYCSSNSLCKPTYQGLINRNSRPYCLCPLDQFGSRCNLKNIQCQNNPCQNQGSCFIIPHMNSFFCSCTSEYYGKNCQFKKQSINFYLNETVEHQAAIVQYFNIDSYKFDLIFVDQQFVEYLPRSLHYFHNETHVPEIILIKIYLSNHIDVYLVSIQIDRVSINETIQLNTKTHCLHRNLRSKISPIEYHQICVDHRDQLCFIDDVYLCICVDNHTRVECFAYNYQQDQCSFCLNQGQCIKNASTSYRCLCPSCHYGRMCQFNSRKMSFTIDSLIIQEKPIVQILYLVLTLLLFLFGSLTNLASFLTFKRINPRKIGAGNYLLIISISNQISLFSLLLKIGHIFFSSLFGNISCKIITFILSTSIRYTNWIISWLTLERVCFVLSPFSTNLKKPRLALKISLFTLILIFLMHIHQLLFYMNITDSLGEHICVANFSSILSTCDYSNTLIHHALPFAVQIISITLLIIYSARYRSKASTRKKNVSFFKILKKQFHNQKELYLTPISIIASGLPQIILSSIFSCTQLVNWQKYCLAIAYFLSYAPQILGFLLFVLPSSNYTKEFQKTKFSKLYLFKFIKQSNTIVYSTQSHFTIKNTPL